MGRRRRSLLDPRGTGTSGGSASGDEGSSEVDWHSQEAGQLGRSSFTDDDDPADAPRKPVRFSPTSGPTLVNETPESGGDPVSTPLDGLPRRLQMPPPAGYQRPEIGGRGERSGPAVDAPVAQDLFGDGGYDDFEAENPPTDEFPAQVMEDVGQPYTTPFSVPDAPPIPGIVDRFTPPPAHRTEIGSRRKKSDFSVETPQAKERYQPTPSPVRRKSLPRSASSTSEPMDRDEEAAAVSPLSLWLGIGGVLFFLVGVVSLVVALIVFMMSKGESDEAAAREALSGGVEIRDNMTRPVAPITDTDAVVPAAPVPTAVPAVPEPGGSKAPAVVPDPKAKSPPPVPAAGPVGYQSLLKIRSNRRVLAYVDDRAIGYTPQDVPVEPGKHRVTAKLPGQPNSQQGRDAVMAEKRQDILVEFSF